MKMGILETGRVSGSLVDRFGPYAEMFAPLFRAAAPSIEFERFPVLDGVLPPSAEACDAWLITGSKHGVYDPLPWIAPLKAFLRRARDAQVPIVGVCFGHQIMAEAFGGRAEKSDKGWGCGVQTYGVVHRPRWLAHAAPSFSMYAMHQDQVVAPPADATCLAGSDFCPYAMLAYGDPEAPEAISIQPHPEFGTAYMRALLELRGGTAVPTVTAEAALAGLATPVDGPAFARWSVAYLEQAVRRRRPAA